MLMKNLLQLSVLSLVPVLLFSCDYGDTTAIIGSTASICSNNNEVTISFYNGTSTDYYWDSVTISGDYMDKACSVGHGFTFSVKHKNVRAKMERELSTISIQRKSGDSPIYVLPSSNICINGKHYCFPFKDADNNASHLFPPYPAIQIMDSIRRQCPEFVLTVLDNQLHTVYCPIHPVPNEPSITIDE